MGWRTHEHASGLHGRPARAEYSTTGLYMAPADVDMPGATAKLLTIATVGLNASPACMPDEVSVKLHLMETKQE